MASVYELAEKYAAARSMARVVDAHAAAYVTDVQAGYGGVGDACRERGYCAVDESFLQPAGRPKVCADCGAPVRAG